MDRMRVLQALAYAVAVGLCLGGLALPAEAAKRLALVIGNSNYQSVVRLPNPVNDAEDIAAKLSELGFEVERGIDLTRSEFLLLISDFRSRIKSEVPEDVVFYYAGHAFNLYGLNQFVPVDARLNDRNLIPLETIRLNDILAQIQVSENQKTVILLDACRNSPLPPELQIEDAGSGLAQLETNDRTANAYLIFATLPKQVTKDGKGRNSPFAGALLKHMGTPGKSLDGIFPDIRRDIMAETNGTQRPFKQGSPPELFYFNPAEPQVALNTPPAILDQEPVPAPPANSSPQFKAPETGGTADPVPPSAPFLEPLKPSDKDIVVGEETGPPQKRPETPATAPLAPVPELPSNPAPVVPPANVAQLDGAAVAEPVERSPPVSEQSGTDILRPGPSDRPPPAVVITDKTERVASLRSVFIRGTELSDAEVGALGGAGLVAPPQEQKDVASLAPPDIAAPDEVLAEPGLAHIIDLQEALKSVGCYTGKVDGLWGDQSRRALQSYLKVKGRDQENTEPTQEMLASLQADTADAPICVAALPQDVEPQPAKRKQQAEPPHPSRKLLPTKKMPVRKASPPAKPRPPAAQNPPAKPWTPMTIGG
jgi:hypothetical protein